MDPDRPPGAERAPGSALLSFGPALAAAAAIGAAAGLGALAFVAATRGLQRALLGDGASFLRSVETLPWWGRLLVPACGAVAAALLVAGFLPGRPPMGVSGIMEAVVLRRGPLRLRDTVVRVLASLGVVGTGGSVGREGPIVELGAALGSRLGSVAGRAEAVPLFIACGAAAGMSAAYRAPLGAVVFVMEVMLGSFSVRRLAPVAVASVAAVTVVRAFAGNDPVYAIPADLGLARWWELSLAALLGILGGFAGPAFLRLLGAGEGAFARLPPSPVLRGAVGGLLVGAMGIAFPEVWGNGFDAVDLILAGRMGLLLMAALLLLKPLATAITTGSGGLGGVFTPTLFLGAALGGLLGGAVHGFAPGATAVPAAYALLGMAAAIGATTHAPVTAVLLLFELTRDYEIVPGLMLSAVLGTLVARRVHPWSHYTQRLHRRGVRMPGNAAEAELLAATAASCMDPPERLVEEGEAVGGVLERLRGMRGDLFVRDRAGRFRGVVRAVDLAGVAGGDIEGVVVAGDLAAPAPWVDPGATLEEALLLLDSSDRDEILVLDGGREIVGILRRGRILDLLRRSG